MRHAIILAHPSPLSFDASAAHVYAAEIRGAGQSAEIRDLYARCFDPRLRATELPWSKDYAPGGDVVVEREWLAGADVIVFVYPFWFNAPPAILKGYVDRVLSMGFGFDPDPSGTKPLLCGKRLVSISSSGAPDNWVDQTGVLSDLRARFDGLLGAVCGLNVVEHLHFGGVTPGLRDDAVAEMLGQVAVMARHHFGPALETPEEPSGRQTELVGDSL